MRSLTVSLVQMDVRKGDPRANWEHVQTMTAEAAERGAQLVVLPELWDAGAAYDISREIASPLDGGLFVQMADLARQHNVYLTGSLYEKHDGQIYNTLAVISPDDGVIGAYRKIHLFPLMDEDKWLAAGTEPLTLELPWGRTAFAICYDLRFPELFRRYADSADVVIVPAEWPHPRLAHFRTMVHARAIENQFYMVAVNRVGKDDDSTHFFGHSCVIDPWGEIVVEAGETACHLTVTIDLDMVQRVRAQLPVLKDRRL